MKTLNTPFFLLCICRTQGYKMRILIGTTGFSYDDWTGPEVFYPPEIETIGDQLCYYMSRFDMLTISSTYEEQPDAALYTDWAKFALKAKKDFSFVVVAPEKVY